MGAKGQDWDGIPGTASFGFPGPLEELTEEDIFGYRKKGGSGGKWSTEPKRNDLAQSLKVEKLTGQPLPV